VLQLGEQLAPQLFREIAFRQGPVQERTHTVPVAELEKARGPDPGAGWESFTPKCGSDEALLGKTSHRLLRAVRHRVEFAFSQAKIRCPARKERTASAEARLTAQK